MPIDQTTVSRLALIKYLFEKAVKESYAPEPLSGLSILSMHDSVELFLQLASERLNVGAAQPAFLEYWEILSPKLSRELTQKESMRRLNKARVGLKHSGTIPSSLDIEGFRASTVNFFEDNVPLIFGKSLAEISLIELVQPESSRDSLHEAQDCVSSGHPVEAMDRIAVAFNELIVDYEQRSRAGLRNPPLSFTRSTAPRITLNAGSQSEKYQEPSREQTRWMDSVDQAIGKLQNATMVLALGLSYSKYMKFVNITPHVSRSVTGKYFIDRKHDKESPPSPADLKFCMDYVIESSLQVQQTFG